MHRQGRPYTVADLQDCLVPCALPAWSTILAMSPTEPASPSQHGVLRHIGDSSAAAAGAWVGADAHACAAT